MQCSNCGATLPPNTRFCTTCGAPVAAPAAPQAVAAAIGPTVNLASSDAAYRQVEGQRLDLPDPKVVQTGEGRSGIDYQIVGTTLQAVISDLESNYSGISDRLVDNGKLHRFVNIYVNDEDVRFSGGLDTEISDGDSVTILPAVAGG